MAGSLGRLGSMLRGTRTPSAPSIPHAGKGAARMVTGSTESRQPTATPSQRGVLLGGNVGGQRIMTPYELASNHPEIPRVSNVGPINIAQYQPLLSSLARYYYRNDGWIRRVVTKHADTCVGVGPQPTSPYDELNDLFSLWWGHVDSRGVNGGGDWLRDDVFTPRMIDGEVFLKRVVAPVTTDANGRPLAYGSQMIPLQYQSLTSDYFPTFNTGFAAPEPGNTVACSIEFDGENPDRRVAYWGYDSFPGDYPRTGDYGLTLNRFPAEEIIHSYSAMVGSPRGEVTLAPAILRAIKLTFIEESEMTRIAVASRFAGFIKETAAAVGESQIRNSRVVGDLMNVMTMAPGTLNRLPPGMDITFSTPPNFIPNQVQNLIFYLSYICAATGVPLHEVTQNYDTVKSDRVIKFATLSYKQVVDREQSKMEHQILQPIWAAFVDWAILTGLWTPPKPSDAWRAYKASWRWPLILTAQMSQEISAMIAAKDAGLVDTDTVSQSYFGMSARDVVTKQANADAFACAMGFVPGPDTATGAPGARVFDPSSSPIAQAIMANASEKAATQQSQIDG